MMDEYESLCKLADAFGIETGYMNLQGAWQKASTDAMLAILNLLGAPIHNPAQALPLLRERLLFKQRVMLSPVQVAWLEQPKDYVEIPLRLESPRMDQGFLARLTLESGEFFEWNFKVRELRPSASEEVEGIRFVTYQIEVPKKIGTGYHNFHLESDSWQKDCLLMAAPQRAFFASMRPQDKSWGLFLPLYAAKSQRNLGAGDFKDLEDILQWTATRGGKVVGTLPMLAAFLDEPYEYSPYSPASRLFWNEFYLNIEGIPEFVRNPQARNLFQSDAFQQKAARLRSLELVDYKEVMALKREVLELLASGFLEKAEPARMEQFLAFVRGKPAAADYARFRATGEKFKASWHTWPDKFKSGNVDEKDLDSSVVLYHQLVQWWCSEQMQALGEKARVLGARGLYLDLPLGVNADSFDVFKHRDLFALGASGGAPPDTFFTLGQDWGFPPIHPEKILEDKLGYLRSVLDHHMRSASMLRVDHVMGLHRLYWVPRGLGAKNGAYVRYPTEPLYALFNLESSRHQTMVVGEDLGTVPDGVRPAMHRHGWHRLFVGQFEWNPGGGRVLNPAPEGAIASMNTHDLPTFSAFWNGLDIRDRMEMNLISPEVALEEQGERQRLREKVMSQFQEKPENLGESGEDEGQAAYLGVLGELSQSHSLVALVSIEDVWKVETPQNVPGTWREKPNWRHKAKYSVLEWDGVSGMGQVLEKIKRC